MTEYKRVALKLRTVLQLSKAKSKMLKENPENSTITDDYAINHILTKYNSPPNEESVSAPQQKE